MELCAGKANWDVMRVEKSVVVQGQGEPRVTVDVKSNELRTHARGGNELGGEQREPK